jgi:hypothetical protein
MNGNFTPTPAPFECGRCQSRNIEYLIIPMSLYASDDPIFVNCIDCDHCRDSGYIQHHW